MTMISSGRTGVLHFELDHDHGWDDGMICGGSIDVAVTLPTDGRTLRDVAEAYRRREATPS
jgi:xanthine/CO dehydrogenase XdhC/CoxF family maturation factor